MAGALENIIDPMRKTLSHSNVDITSNTILQLVPGVAGARIKIRRLEISSDIAAKFTISSGVNSIFSMHAGQLWGRIDKDSDECGKYVCNTGEAFNIQSDQASLDANIYLQYWYDTSPGDYSR